MKLNSTLISCAEAAELLGISEQRVRQLCRDGNLPSSKVGRSWVIEQAVAEEYGMRAALIVAEDHAVYNCSQSQSRPIALSFFSGAMGLDLGLERSGFEIRLACESDKYCRQTIAINRPEVALMGNVLDCTAESVRSAAGLKMNEEIDLVAGGPPCQAFSTAGKRKGLADARGNVFLHFVDLALKLSPKFIVIENVRGLLSCPLRHRPHDKRGGDNSALNLEEQSGGALRFILKRLQESGYSYAFNLYNAANFGTPQCRERVVLICSRNGREVPYLEPTHSNASEFQLPAWRTFRDAVRGLEESPCLKFPEKRLKYYRMLKAGQNWRNLPLETQKEALGKSFYSGGGKTGFLRRLAWDSPSPTLVTHPAMPATDLAHPVEDRPLSIGEYKRLQEFPDTWQLAGNLVQQYKQVGNAVPTSLGFAIGNLIHRLLSDKPILSIPGFPYSRYKCTDHRSWEAQFDQELPFSKVSY